MICYWSKRFCDSRLACDKVFFVDDCGLGFFVCLGVWGCFCYWLGFCFVVFLLYLSTYLMSSHIFFTFNMSSWYELSLLGSIAILCQIILQKLFLKKSSKIKNSISFYLHYAKGWVIYAKEKIRIDSKIENKYRSNLKNIYVPSDSYLNKSRYYNDKWSNLNIRKI